MKNERRTRTFEKESARIIITGNFLREDYKTGKKLSREFLRTPYGLSIKEGNKMTEDTKKALEAIKPLAAVLKIDVMSEGEKLYCNGQRIGIACNSTWATCMEFIGYAFLKVYCKDKCITASKQIKERITRYWYQD